MNWDDIKIFLALARSDNIREAADRCNVSYSTISRRIDGFERQLCARLFDRLPSGFVLTATGEELLPLAEDIEDRVAEADRRVFGKESKLAGLIKLSMVDALATNLLMPDLAEFNEIYPDIELELDIGYGAADLARRETDLALRFAQNPPEDLIGRKLAACATAPYATQEYIRKHGLKTTPNGGRWIGFHRGRSQPLWLRNSAFPALPVWGQLRASMPKWKPAKPKWVSPCCPAFSPTRSLAFTGSPRPTALQGSTCGCSDTQIYAVMQGCAAFPIS
ncbi:MAG: LysR family transcriptional regulator [Rhodobacteraceae bacterium]|nr:LysR family transcriptional regulator [Paracoccaceae bacterium]